MDARGMSGHGAGRVPMATWSNGPRPTDALAIITVAREILFSSSDSDGAHLDRNVAVCRFGRCVNDDREKRLPVSGSAEINRLFSYPPLFPKMRAIRFFAFFACFERHSVALFPP